MRRSWRSATMVAVSLPLLGATRTVDLDGGDGYTAIQPAIGAKAGGDIMRLDQEKETDDAARGNDDESERQSVQR